MHLVSCPLHSDASGILSSHAEDSALRILFQTLDIGLFDRNATTLIVGAWSPADDKRRGREARARGRREVDILLLDGKRNIIHAFEIKGGAQVMDSDGRMVTRHNQQPFEQLRSAVDKALTAYRKSLKPHEHDYQPRVTYTVWYPEAPFDIELQRRCRKDDQMLVLARPDYRRLHGLLDRLTPAQEDAAQPLYLNPSRRRDILEFFEHTCPENHQPRRVTDWDELRHQVEQDTAFEPRPEPPSTAKEVLAASRQTLEEAEVIEADSEVIDADITDYMPEPRDHKRLAPPPERGRGRARLLFLTVFLIGLGIAAWNWSLSHIAATDESVAAETPPPPRVPAPPLPQRQPAAAETRPRDGECREAEVLGTTGPDGGTLTRQVCWSAERSRWEF